MTERLSRQGLTLGLAAFTIWGVLPLYLKLLAVAPALQVLAHRILWSLLLLGALVLVKGRVGAIRRAATLRVVALLAVTATLIGVNWWVYIWAVGNGHALDGSLGYFINPILNVGLGVVLLGERLRRAQGVAVALAAAGAVALGVGGGVAALWIPLTLAVSFSLYGLLRKLVAIDALGGLTIETLLLAPFALGYLLVMAGEGSAAFGRETGLDLLLIGSGVATALPLLLFTAAARLLPLSTLGIVQYLGPSLQFVCATAVFGEAVHDYHLVAFALIWCGCALFAWDGWRARER